MLLFPWCTVNAIPAKDKPWVIVRTDIENEPGDVEGIIATTSVWQKDRTAMWRILNQ